MAKNIVGSHNLEPGAAWTFVHSDGRRVLYEYDHLIADGLPGTEKSPLPKSPMHALLNPETGKCAEVSEKWLIEGPVSSGSSKSGFYAHWLVGEVAAELADAA